MTSSAPQSAPKPSPLIGYLLGLAGRREKDGDARAALANLRRAARNPDNPPPAALKHIVRYLRDGAAAAETTAHVLVGSLFALAPTAYDGVGNLGDALRRVGEKSNSESLERRFMALLAASPEEVPHHLRQALSLVGAHGVALSWNELLKDVRGLLSDKESLSHEGRTWRDDVIQRWARSFWSPTKVETEDEDATATSTANRPSPDNTKE